MTLSETIQTMKSEWCEPRGASHRGSQISFKLACTFSEQGIAPEILDKLDVILPEPLSEFWFYSKSARLFEDKAYGQWGVEIFYPERAIQETELQRRARTKDFKYGDLVIGQFLGDADLLAIRCDQHDDDFGQVFVALPIDSRSDWYFISGTFSEFLEKYLLFHGDKFWEYDKS